MKQPVSVGRAATTTIGPAAVAAAVAGALTARAGVPARGTILATTTAALAGLAAGAALLTRYALAGIDWDLYDDDAYDEGLRSY